MFGYLSDFLVMGTTECESELALNVLSKLLSYLGFDIASQKVIRPSQVVKY